MNFKPYSPHLDPDNFPAPNEKPSVNALNVAIAVGSLVTANNTHTPKPPVWTAEHLFKGDEELVFKPVPGRKPSDTKPERTIF